MTRIRKAIYMNDTLANWYEEKANSIGINTSALMVMALVEYIKQEKTIDMMANFKDMVDRAEKGQV